MGADNWARCPRCAQRAVAALEKLEQQVNKAYGKVPVEKFDEMRANLSHQRRIIDAESFKTFGEYYDFSGVEEGVVTVSYSGSCTQCGLKFKLQEDHPIPGL